MNTKLLAAMAGFAGIALAAQPASAAVTVYSGLDAGQASPVGPNSAAAQAAFIAAAGPLSTIDFESPVPSGVSISGGSITTGSLCGFALCGDNTTAGGAFYLNVIGGTSTFTFTTPISAFGAYFSGGQLTESMTFTDGSSQEVFIPNGTLDSGGMSFAGWTSTGLVTSITINTGTGADYCTQCDIIGVDDVKFTAAAIPEPESYALMLAGLAMLGFMRRRKALTPA